MTTTPPQSAGSKPAADVVAADVVAFWREAGPQRWFAKDEAFDRDFTARFLNAHYAAARREHEGWLDSAEGALALMVLLDQFPRNAFRGTAHMFATDPLALHYARTALDRGLDQQLEPALRLFLYLPFMHSEQLPDQQRCLALCQALGQSEDYAQEHLDIIAKFGRFPHRNPQLARTTTPQEQAYLDGGGFAG